MQRLLLFPFIIVEGFFLNGFYYLDLEYFIEMDKPRFYINYWFLKDYSILWQLQKEMFYRNNKYINKKYNFLMFAEHNPVYTIGRNSQLTNLLRLDKKTNYKKIPILKVDRGGDLTYHGPGQLVCYFILDIFLYNYEINIFLRLFENMIISILLKYKVFGFRIINKAGIWIIDSGYNLNKICSIGIKILNDITRHGLSLNINNDLNNFDSIRPCGIHQDGVTSIYTAEKKDYIQIKLLLKNILSFFFKIGYLPKL
ncbi:lipoyl(octanoyl) transferase LipB [Candidatus Karelsulcia muelleri]